MPLRERQTEFIEQFNAHRKILYKLAFMYCRQSDDRKDLIQEMLVQVWRSYDSFDGSVKFSTWMYRVAANTAISFYRSTQHGKQGLISVEDLDLDIQAADQVFDESGEAMRILCSLIAEMDELNGALILLYLDGHSYEEIATTLGISTSNVGTRINRIKQKLKESLL